MQEINMLRRLQVISLLHLDLLEHSSNCKNKKVGAYLLDNTGAVVGTGFNYFLFNRCKSTLGNGCPRHFSKPTQKQCPAIHAEVHAIIRYLGMNPEDLKEYNTNSDIVDNLIQVGAFKNICEGFFIYASYSPCPSCLKLAEYVGIKHIFFNKEHHKTRLSNKLDMWQYKLIGDGDYLFTLFR